MADNLDYPGPNDPKPAPPPEGDLPTDFFDDLKDSDPAPAPPPPPPVRDVPPPPVSPPPKFAPAPAEKVRHGLPVFPMLLVLALAGALGGAWYYNQRPRPEPAPAKPLEATPAADATGPAPADALAEQVKGVVSRQEKLETQLASLQSQVGSLSKPAPAPDLTPIQGKVDDLHKAVTAVTPLNEKVGQLEERLKADDGALKSLREEVAALSGKVEKLAAAPAPKPADEPKTDPKPEPKPAADDTAAALAKGGDLFKAGKFKDADDVFKTLEAGNPKDARVYYYGALARGAATGDWAGDAVKLVTRGVELEKEGHPKAAEIDGTFAGIAPQLKPWLDAYRLRAR